MKGWGKTLRGVIELVSNLSFGDGGFATSMVTDDTDSLDSDVAFHFGFYSRPKDGARGIVLRADGQGNTSFLVGWRDQQYELSLQKGECGMQNAFGASVLLDKDGNVTSVPGGTGKVQQGSATPTDAAVLGTTFSTALNTFLTAMTTFNTALNTLNVALVPTTGVTPGAPATFTAAGTAFGVAITALKNAAILSQIVELS